jgi:dTDP-4-dehydrorhamnose 3,5-epimerase
VDRVTRLEPAQMPGIKVLTAKRFPDERGWLIQSWVKADLEAAGIPATFGQAIQTVSRKGVVRGLHFQWDPPMGKYVRCLHGAILDVVVDVRHGSPTVGKHVAVELNDRNDRVIWVPPGFAHGTFALEEGSIVLYECTSEHGPGREGGILWNDPALEIDWPKISPIVSEKDGLAPTLAEWLEDERSRHFRFA